MYVFSFFSLQIFVSFAEELNTSKTKGLIANKRTVKANAVDPIVPKILQERRPPSGASSNDIINDDNSSVSINLPVSIVPGPISMY
jgi:hypothetical protein